MLNNQVHPDLFLGKTSLNINLQGKLYSYLGLKIFCCMRMTKKLWFTCSRQHKHYEEYIIFSIHWHLNVCQKQNGSIFTSNSNFYSKIVQEKSVINKWQMEHTLGNEWNWTKRRLWPQSACPSYRQSAVYFCSNDSVISWLRVWGGRRLMKLGCDLPCWAWFATNYASLQNADAMTDLCYHGKEGGLNKGRELNRLSEKWATYLMLHKHRTEAAV